MTETVTIVEVSARDGLQNESKLVGTEDKIAMIAAAARAGLRRMEVASFVNPKKVPQMADGAAVMAGLAAIPGIAPIALALNARGAERAIDAGAREINFVLAASDTFALRNSGAPMAGLLTAFEEAAAICRARGARIGVTIAVSFGCPFEGEVPAGRVADLAGAAAAHGPFEIAIADTIGAGCPRQVRELVTRTRAAVGPQTPLRAHFHDTRNLGAANALAAFEAGVFVLDGSLAGIGGCPFAPGATGNVATEDLAWMFERSGVATGVDLDLAIEAARMIGAILGKATPGGVSRAGRFPQSRAT